MTLTAILPSLRRSIPDPFDAEKWPEGTLPTTTDVMVSGLSLVRVAELSGTPCSISGCSIVPGTNGRLSTTHRSTVTIFRIGSIETDAGGSLTIRVTAQWADRSDDWSEVRLIGRASTAYARPARLEFDHHGLVDPVVGTLPSDVGVGDLLAVPSAPAEVAPEPDLSGPELEMASPGQPSWLSTLA